MDTQEEVDFSNTQLATLLAESYKDAENLRRELASAKKRAEKAERVLVNLQTAQQASADASSVSGPSPDVSRMIMDYEDRIARAERGRDEAEARRRTIHDTWASLDRYFSLVETRAHDARLHFGRVVSGEITSVSLLPITPYASSHVFPPLPPHPNPNPGRRPRTPSLESSFQQPPSKRSRGDSDDRGRHPAYPPPGFQPRMIRPGGHVGPGQQRSRSRSSDKSISSVDEMLLQATNTESNGATNGNRRPIHPPNAYPQPQQQQRSHPDSPPYSTSTRPRGDHSGPLPYLFAPVVTGAPPKKSKYSNTATTTTNTTTTSTVTPAGSASSIGGPIETPPVPTPPVAAFPPTNAEGQRICRQCGLPGRYKDGKCVEKWGPGPMGPGTVCDRCRKKMKRVERRGTLEANANNVGRQQHHVVQQPPQQQQQQHPPALQRSDTVLTQQMSFRTVMSTTPGKGRAMSPPPAIASLKDDTSSSQTAPAKRSPLPSGSENKDPSPRRVEADGETDADAEAEVDVDADGDGEGDHEEYEIDDDDDGPPQRKVQRAAREADEELLEAVDAAEALYPV